jgi:glutamate 5-kinase
MRKRTRWIIKAGSNMVCTGGPLLLRSWMQQVASLRKLHGIEIIWVTSGAIASASERTGRQRSASKSRSLIEKQALSAIGQPLVMDLYNLALHATGQLGAQVLLTYDDLANRARRENFRNTIEQLLRWGVVPILNENDAVATEEIRFGDNDSLAAKVAGEVGARRLVILTDVQGLCESDPRLDPTAKLVPRVKHVSGALLKSVTPGAGTTHGTGGMYSKLLAAREAARHGVETWLIKGDLPGALLAAAEKREIGTIIDAGARR